MARIGVSTSIRARFSIGKSLCPFMHIIITKRVKVRIRLRVSFRVHVSTVSLAAH